MAGKTYTFTVKMPENLDTEDGDAIPDKYQAKVKYVVKEKTGITVDKVIVKVDGIKE